MSTTPITTTVNGTQYINGSPVAKVAKKTLDMGSFLQLLTTEMQNQDPTKPMDDATYFGQIAAMGSVQGITSLQQIQNQTQADALIGKKVQGVVSTSNNGTAVTTNVSGTVQYVFTQSGTPYLGVKDSSGSVTQMTLDQITQVSA